MSTEVLTRQERERGSGYWACLGFGYGRRGFVGSCSIFGVIMIRTGGRGGSGVACCGVLFGTSCILVGYRVFQHSGVRRCHNCGLADDGIRSIVCAWGVVFRLLVGPSLSQLWQIYI